MKALEIATSSGGPLNGALFGDGKSDTVVIAITGVHGNFYSNPFYVNIGQTLSKAGIDFLYAQTRDVFGEIEGIEGTNAITGEKEVIGFWNEKFPVCIRGCRSLCRLCGATRL